MSRCEFSDRLGPLVDGELAADEAARVEAHAAVCVPCAEELSELRGLRRMFAAAASESARWPAGVARRAGEHAEALTEQGILRLARALTGIAASVLLAGAAALWLAAPGRPSAAHPPPVPAQVAVLPPSALETSPPAPSSADDLATPEWVLADLTGSRTWNDDGF